MIKSLLYGKITNFDTSLLRLYVNRLTSTGLLSLETVLMQALGLRHQPTANCICFTFLRSEEVNISRVKSENETVRKEQCF